jgi:hypothetical protein
VAEVPPRATTVTFTVPVPAGLVAMICVAEVTVKLLAATVPKSTSVAPVNPVPVIVTDVPPDVDPDLGLMPVTAGGATYVNWSADEVAEVPPGVTTVTSTVPAVPAGLVAVICVSVSLLIFAVTLPKSTPVAPARFVPVIVTAVPPEVDPDVGLRLVTVGGDVSITMFWVAKPSRRVVGRVNAATLPALSTILPPLSVSAAIEA